MSDHQQPDGYRTQSEDTSPAAEMVQVAAWRRMSPEERFRRTWELSDFVRRIAEANVRQRHPGASGREIRLRVASRYLDRELMVRAFGWDPAVNGY